MCNVEKDTRYTLTCMFFGQKETVRNIINIIALY
jgi:hypothetical protein